MVHGSWLDPFGFAFVWPFAVSFGGVHLHVHGTVSREMRLSLA